MPRSSRAEDAPYQTTLKNISITEFAMCPPKVKVRSQVQISSAVNLDRSNIERVTQVCLLLAKGASLSDNTGHIFAVNISNFNQNGTAASPWTGATQLFFPSGGPPASCLDNAGRP